MPPSHVAPTKTGPAPRFRRRPLLVLLVVVLSAVAVVVGKDVASPWRPVFSESFDTDAELGSFATSSYRHRWGVYPDGWPNTGRSGTYQPTEVVSVHDGTLDLWLRTTASGPASAAVLPSLPRPQTYGRYSVRFRADPVPGYKLAFLLWPDSERWPADGEIDFPEGVLDGTVGAFAHHASESGTQESFPTGARFEEWHVATTEWTPGRVRFLLDDQLVGESTTQVPAVPMHWVLQTEAASADLPPVDAEGHVLVDWVRAWSYE